MTSAEPFWLFIGLAVCAALVWLYRRFDARQRTALTTFASSHLLGQLTASFSTARRTLKRVLYVAAVACVFAALARPQWGFRWEEAKRKGIDILFAVDTSKSMLAQDVKPDRITRAKLAVTDLVGKLDGDRVGLIAFAGDAFLQSPLTLDYDAFRQSLDALDVGIVPRGGTDVASAIQEAQVAFGPDTRNQKILVLITDGEDLEAKGVDAAKAAAKNGLKVYTIGVGSTTGELIPVPDDNGGTNFLKDDAGNYVKSHLDESTLKQIAGATDALYAPLGQQGQGLEMVYEHALAPLPKQELASRLQKVMIERFQWPLALGIVLLVAEMFIGTRKGRERKRRFAPVPASKPRVKIHRAPALEPVGLAVIALCVAAASAHASPQSAESAFKKGDYTAAESQYQQAAAANPKLAALQYNEGTAAYKAGQYDKALPAFQKTLETDKLELQQQAYYNLGNTQYRVGQQTEQAKPQNTIKTWQGAVASYDAALKLRADDADAKFNRDLVQKKLDQLQKQQQQKQDQQKKDQRNKDQTSKDQNKNDQQDKDQSPKDQQSKDQSPKDQQDKDQKDQQNQPPKPDNKDQNGQPKPGDQQPGNEPPKPSPGGQDKQPAQPGKSDQKPQPTPGEAQPSPSPQPGQDQEQPEAQGQPGQMSPQEAKSLLDSLKKDEHALPATPDARNTGQPQQDQPTKDW